MVIAITRTRIAAYDPVSQQFVDMPIADALRIEVHAAADLIRRDMLCDDAAFLIVREAAKTAQIAAQTL